MPHQNTNRPGLRTSASIAPQWIAEDVSYEIKRLDPEQAPFYSVLDKFSRGKPPTSHKILQTRYDAFDHWDKATFRAAGPIGADNDRAARISVAQVSRPNVSALYYHVQDRLAIPSTGQTLEVIMTPTERYQVAGGHLTLDPALTGHTATATQANNIIVRNVEPYPIIPFTTTDIVYLGRTIRESQDVGATPNMRDVWFDYNFIEHKECAVHMTNDALNLIKTHGKVADWVFQKEEQYNEFRRSIDYTLLFGERSINFDVEGEPIRSTQGILNGMHENVMYYNPFSVVSMEKIIRTFMMRQAYRFNPNGNRKVGVCGRLFAELFADSFTDQRRLTNSELLKGKYGVTVSSYEFNGYILDLMVTDSFRMQSDTAWWCLVYDPGEIELRVKIDFDSWFYQLAHERKRKLVTEWQGALSPHRTEAHALLRTAGM